MSKNIERYFPRLLWGSSSRNTSISCPSLSSKVTLECCFGILQSYLAEFLIKFGTRSSNTHCPLLGPYLIKEALSLEFFQIRLSLGCCCLPCAPQAKASPLDLLDSSFVFISILISPRSAILNPQIAQQKSKFEPHSSYLYFDFLLKQCL